MQAKGKISSWNDNKGFGFITPSTGGKQVFIHISAFKNRNLQPAINQSVSYTLSTDKQGRTCAAMACYVGKKLPQKNRSQKSALPIFVITIFFGIVCASAYLAKTPLLIVPFYIVISLVTFIVYAVDKSAAQKGNWRTQESTLHFLSIAGGWPGALMAQQLFRHKPKKQSFRFVFWVTVLMNIGGFVWLHTPSGTTVLQGFIANTM